VLKTISAMPAYQDNPIINKYRAMVDLMSESAAAGHNLGWETTRHRPNVQAGRIIASHVLSEAVQRYVINNEPMAQVVSTTAQRLDQLMKTS
jgi:multiple sugar transport system substrate-binding protein